MKLFLYLAVMAGVTYAIRVIPFTFFTKKISSRYIRSFLYYVPYAVLSAMTFPAIFYSTGNKVTSLCGTLAAIVLAFFGCPLTVVAVVSAVTAVIASFLC